MGKPWIDDPNSVVEKGPYKGRTWQSLMDETLTCGNIFCELGEDGGRKVLTYEEWADGRKYDIPTMWMSRKVEPRGLSKTSLIGFCCSSCSSRYQAYKGLFGEEMADKRMSEGELREALSELLLLLTGSDEVTSENLYQLNTTMTSHFLLDEIPAAKHLLTLIYWHAYGHGGCSGPSMNRWTVLKLIERYYPVVHEEFMNTHFWLLSRRTRSMMEYGKEQTLLRDNLTAIDFILKCGIKDWETKRGRALTVDDLIEFGWIYPNTEPQYESRETHLETNELYAMFKDIGECEGDLARVLFGFRVSRPTKTVTGNIVSGAKYTTTVYSPRGESGRDIETLLTHLEQKVRFRDVPVSDALRDGRGRYVRRRCTFEAIASRFHTRANRSRGYDVGTNWFNNHNKWQDIDFRRRMIAKTVSYLRPNVNVTEDFPHDLSHEDMFKVANLSLKMLETVSTWYPITCASRLSKYNFQSNSGGVWGIQTILEANWDIETDELVWNHNHTLPELEVHTFLNDMVDSMSMGRARVVMRYRRPLSWAIGNGSKRKPYMCYMDTGMPIVFDLYVPRFKVTNPDSEHYGQWVDECVVEIQGPHHYEVVEWSKGGKRAANAKAIDESHPEWEKWLKSHEDIVRHDRIKKRRLGKSIAYIPVYENATPVAGVHGDLGTYNFRHVTEENPREGQHGLSELFEMQDKKTIGSLLREWYGWYQSLRNGVTAS